MKGRHRNRPKNPLDHEPLAVTYARQQAGLTKTELARRCGVSLSLISEIESGTRNATPAMIRTLARALNCPRVILERKRDDDDPPPPAPLPAPSPLPRPPGPGTVLRAGRW
jgi:transcriptional regulator with XRE-family HTH domain